MKTFQSQTLDPHPWAKIIRTRGNTSSVGSGDEWGKPSYEPRARYVTPNVNRALLAFRAAFRADGKYFGDPVELPGFADSLDDAMVGTTAEEREHAYKVIIRGWRALGSPRTTAEFREWCEAYMQEDEAQRQAAYTAADTLAAECDSCGEEMPLNECPKSKRPCGHHCNHSWKSDECCWCGAEFGEGGEIIAAPEGA